LIIQGRDATGSDEIERLFASEIPSLIEVDAR